MTDVRGEAGSHPANYAVDYLTVIGLSMLAYTLSTLLHEYLGHALTCVCLGGQPTELGAFYVNFEYGSMSETSIRLVALAGPIVSLMTGMLSFLCLNRIPQTSPHLRYWTWLFGTISLMTAAGYLLFSGCSGLGDLGTSRDGALYLVRPEWLWRLAIAALGGAGYFLIISLALRKIGEIIGGEGPARVAQAQKLAFTSYLTGAFISVVIGLFNPHGIFIVLASAAASSLGGTSGLAWMMQLLKRDSISTAAPLQLKRSWPWILTGSIVTLLYALLFGPTLHL